MSLRNTGPCEGIFRIERHRMLEAFQRERTHWTPSIKESSPLDVEFVRLQSFRARLNQGPFDLDFQCDLQTLRNGAGDFILNRKNILHLAIVTLRPHMKSISSVD